MKRIGIPVLAVALMAGAAGWAQSSSSPQENTAPDPDTVHVQLVNRIPQVDRGNLTAYWPVVASRAKDQWMQTLPAVAKPPVSMAGEVKIVAWLHTDGRVTGMALEERSGKPALDRAAWSAITGAAPFDAFPYGISVNQVRVRFTFDYNQGAGIPDNSPPPPGPIVKRRPH
jgi:TonB family protein